MIISQLLQECSFLELAISATTRSPRSQEIHGKDYYFFSEAEFDHHIKNEDFVEWCSVHTFRYGTLKQEFERINESGGYSLLEIDVKGSKKIKSIYPNALTVFIAPPSVSSLKDRLLHRNTEGVQDVSIRLTTAKKELQEIYDFDYLLINDKISYSVSLLKTLIQKSYQS